MAVWYGSKRLCPLRYLKRCRFGFFTVGVPARPGSNEFGLGGSGGGVINMIGLSIFFLLLVSFGKWINVRYKLLNLID